LAVNHMYYGLKRNYTDSYDLMHGSYLGPYYSAKEIHFVNRKFKAQTSQLEYPDLYSIIAKLLSEGNVIGWFQGRSEFGPRALGNRSILADPRNPEMQKKLNLKIKYREGFRPFAPSVLEEDYSMDFQDKLKSPYMLLVKNVKENIKLRVPENYSELDYRDKLYTQRSLLQD